MTAEQSMGMFFNPQNVVETDKKCSVMQMEREMGKVQNCTKEDYGYEFEEDIEPEAMTELCGKILTGVDECVLDHKVDCFSYRENMFLSGTMKAAYSDIREIYAMDEVQKIVDKDMTVNQKNLIECALGLHTNKEAPIEVTET